MAACACGEQQWQFVPVGAGYYAVLNRNGGKVLDLTGGHITGGTTIQQWDYWGRIEPAVADYASNLLQHCQ